MPYAEVLCSIKRSAMGERGTARQVNEMLSVLNFFSILRSAHTKPYQTEMQKKAKNAEKKENFDGTKWKSSGKTSKHTFND